MLSYLSWTDPCRRSGSFDRSDYGDNLLARKMDYRGLVFNKSRIACLFRDRLADALAEKGVLEPSAVEAYTRSVAELFFVQPLLEHSSNEAVFRIVQKMRVAAFGADCFRAAEPLKSTVVEGIDQTALCRSLFTRSAVVCYLSDLAYAQAAQAELLPLMKAGRQVYFLAAEDGNGILPTAADLRALFAAGDGNVLTVCDTFGAMDFARVPFHADLQAAIDRADAFLCGYGTDALMAARGLKLPASVLVLPEDLPSKAVTNLFSRPALCRIYIPAHFDITPHVPFLRPSALTYYHLAYLAQRFGASVYEKTPEELYLLEPRLFFSMYDSHLPPKTDNHFTYSGGSLLSARQSYLDRALSRMSGVRYLHAYLQKPDLTPAVPDYEDASPRHCLLVNGVLAAPGSAVTVFPGGSGIDSPRDRFFDSTDGGISFISNFAFFFTDRLTDQYQRLRKDRKPEQLRAPVGYVDLRCYTDAGGRRHESFPLYRKACLAKRKSGGFTAFPFEFRGGTVTLGGVPFSVDRFQVNRADGELALFTPMLSVRDEDASAADYTLPVGEGRLNVILIGETVRCIRRGNVLLPPVGVVLSLAGSEAERLIALLPPPDGDGYYPIPEHLTVSLRLNAPEGMTQAEWDGLEWVYGGGICLIDKNGTMTEDTYCDMLRKEGWLSPLSRQTQESAVHTLALHPRTAVGVTKQGELFVLVFSGRTPISEGANYLEMCAAAQRLIGGIDTMINWDGGGSSLLGLLNGSVFTELNYTAPSGDSLTGMARKINSMIQIHISGKDVTL